jgi:hypothetical protein
MKKKSLAAYEKKLPELMRLATKKAQERHLEAGHAVCVQEGEHLVLKQRVDGKLTTKVIGQVEPWIPIQKD